MEKPHKKLEAWKQSMDLVIEIYRTTENFPSQEIYGLTNQIRRAVVAFRATSPKARQGRQKRSSQITFTWPKAH